MYSNILYFVIKSFCYSFFMFYYVLLNVPLSFFMILSFMAKLHYDQSVMPWKCLQQECLQQRCPTKTLLVKIPHMVIIILCYNKENLMSQSLMVDGFSWITAFHTKEGRTEIWTATPPALCEDLSSLCFYTHWVHLPAECSAGNPFISKALMQMTL